MHISIKDFSRKGSFFFILAILSASMVIASEASHPHPLCAEKIRDLYVIAHPETKSGLEARFQRGATVVDEIVLELTTSSERVDTIVADLRRMSIRVPQTREVLQEGKYRVEIGVKVYETDSVTLSKTGDQLKLAASDLTEVTNENGDGSAKAKRFWLVVGGDLRGIDHIVSKYPKEIVSVFDKPERFEELVIAPPVHTSSLLHPEFLVQFSGYTRYSSRNDPVNPASDARIKVPPMSEEVRQQLLRDMNLTPHFSGGSSDRAQESAKGPTQSAQNESVTVPTNSSSSKSHYLPARDMGFE